MAMIQKMNSDSTRADLPQRIRDPRGRLPRAANLHNINFVTTDLIGLRVTSSLARSIDDWRSEQKERISRSEAIRRLIKFALAAAPLLTSAMDDKTLDSHQRQSISALLSYLKGIQPL